MTDILLQDGRHGIARWRTWFCSIGADAGAEPRQRRVAERRDGLLGAAVRAPAGRGRRAAHVHALHQPRALPTPARHHVQQARLHTAEQGDAFCCYMLLDFN